MKNEKVLYKVYRKEYEKKKLMGSYSFEDIEQFKLIVKNKNYIILYNDKNINKKYI